MENKYMEISFVKTWFRIGGIGKRIKNLDPPPHWRFEVAGDSEQYLLNDFRFSGTATTENNQPGTNPHAQGDELAAWIAGYGNASVDKDGNAAFELLDPPDPSPWK